MAVRRSDGLSGGYGEHGVHTEPRRSRRTHGDDGCREDRPRRPTAPCACSAPLRQRGPAARATGGRREPACGRRCAMRTRRASSVRLRCVRVQPRAPPSPSRRRRTPPGPPTVVGSRQLRADRYVSAARMLVTDRTVRRRARRRCDQFRASAMRNMSCSELGLPTLAIHTARRPGDEEAGSWHARS